MKHPPSPFLIALSDLLQQLTDSIRSSFVCSGILTFNLECSLVDSLDLALASKNPIYCSARESRSLSTTHTTPSLQMTVLYLLSLKLTL